MDWYNETITSAIDKVVRRNPGAEAVVEGSERLTYQELADRARKVATGMSRMGITSGEHIGVLHPNAIVVQVLHYASACLGTVYVPLNTMFSPRDLSYILRHSDITTLFVGGRHRDRSLAETVLKAVPELRLTDGPELVLPNHPKLKRIVELDHGERVAAAFVPLDDVEKAGGKEPLPFVNQERMPDSISHLMYTSGSVGFPKGALLTHRGMVGGAFWWGEALCLGSSDRFLALLPFYHTGGLVIASMAVHLRGGCVHIIERSDPKEILETIQRERITTIIAFDAQIQAILEHPERSQYDISSWQKTSKFLGDSYDRRVEAGISCVVGLYALTEASNPVCLVMPDEKRYAIRRDSCGRALPGVEVKIVDSDTEEELLPGMPGEIRFRGWNRFVGYYKPGSDESSDKVFDSNGFFRTGDRGYLDHEGYFYFVNRFKDMIKTGGENVSPAEIEEFLCNKFPAILLAQVVGVPDERWGETVTAFVEMKPGTDYTTQDIIKVCKEHLSGFKVPKHVFFVQSGDWPMTSTAKIRRDDLRMRAMEALAGQEEKPR